MSCAPMTTQISLLGSLTKSGSNYLLNLLIQGAKPLVLASKHNEDPISKWAQRVSESHRGTRQQERADSLGCHDQEQAL